MSSVDLWTHDFDKVIETRKGKEVLFATYVEFLTRNHWTAYSQMKRKYQFDSIFEISELLIKCENYLTHALRLQILVHNTPDMDDHTNAEQIRRDGIILQDIIVQGLVDYISYLKSAKLSTEQVEIMEEQKDIAKLTLKATKIVLVITIVIGLFQVVLAFI